MSFWGTVKRVGTGIATGGLSELGNLADSAGLGYNTEKVGKGAADYGFYDYGGNMQNAYNQLGNEYNFNKQQMGQYAGQVGDIQSSYDPNSYMNAFLGSVGGLSNAVSGQNSQLQQSLNALASKQAAEGVNAQAQNFANMGALNSGAAMASMGEAMANPYAQVQAQLQQNQLQGTLGLMNNAMGNYASGYQAQGQQNLAAQQANQNANLNLANMYGQQYGNALNQYGNMGSQFGTIAAPTYQSTPGWGQNLLNAGSQFAGMAGSGKMMGLF